MALVLGDALDTAIGMPAGKRYSASSRSASLTPPFAMDTRGKKENVPNFDTKGIGPQHDPPHLAKESCGAVDAIVRGNDMSGGGVILRHNGGGPLLLVVVRHVEKCWRRGVVVVKEGEGRGQSRVRWGTRKNGGGWT